MANRTFVRLGALTGACAALHMAAAVCIAGVFASVRPAVWPVAPDWARHCVHVIEATKARRCVFDCSFIIWRVLIHGVRRQAPAAHALRAGRRREDFWRCVGFCVFLEFWLFVNALNCVSYGEPDVRPAGRPDGRVRGLAHSGGRPRCGVLRVG